MSAAFKVQATPTQKLVLLALCDCANDQGECFPSVTLLERKTSLSDRAVQKAIHELEAHGFLSRSMLPGRANTYQITPERGSPPIPPPNVVHP